VNEAELTKLVDDELTDYGLTDKEVQLAVRSAFTFLTACVEGQIPEADVGDRITAARSVLEHAARRPDLMGELADIAGLASEDDVAVIATLLE